MWSHSCERAERLATLNMCGNQRLIRMSVLTVKLVWGKVYYCSLFAPYPRLAVLGAAGNSAVTALMSPHHCGDYSHTTLHKALFKSWALELKSSYLCNKYPAPKPSSQTQVCQVRIFSLKKINCGKSVCWEAKFQSSVLITETLKHPSGAI